jgi:uncharacterized membrane protein
MSHHESAAEGSGARMVDRMLFFSDAVFAIVLTLLALELRPPETHDEQALIQGLSEMGRHFASFAISFALGGGNWLVHMRNARTLRQFDWPCAAANLLHLFTVTLLPFAAAILGEHITSPAAFNVYSVVIVLASFTAAVFWLTATRDNGRLVGGITGRLRAATALRTSAIGIGFCCGLIFAAFGADTIARFSWALMIPIMFIAKRLGRPAQPAAPP